MYHRDRMCINISQWSKESASGHLLNVGVSSRYLFRPFGVYLGLRAKPHRPPSTNTVLEDFYRKSTSSKQKISDADVGQLAEKLGMKARQIERWIRLYLRVSRMLRPKLGRFFCFWRFHSFILTGLFISVRVSLSCLYFFDESVLVKKNLLFNATEQSMTSQQLVW